VFVGLFAAPRLAASLGKKNAAVLLWIAIILASPVMYWARLAGLLPANGTSVLYWLLFASSFVNTLLAVCIGVTGSSLLADVVEHTAARTGRHAAGLIFSTNAFLMKATSGIGAFGAGMILAYVGFPEGAKAGDVPARILERLGWTEPTVVILLQAAALALVLAYPITRAMHEANLRRIATRA
jgi:glycoside/pentoside/hexuronide:cation symporter, GPH family